MKAKILPMEAILLKGIKKQKKEEKLTTEENYEIIGEKLKKLKSFERLETDVPFDKPLLVQKIVIPYILKKKSVIVRSFTGSGKTLAYSLPLVELCKKEKTFAVVLVPTAALVKQVYRVIEEIKDENLKLTGLYESNNDVFTIYSESNEIKETKYTGITEKLEKALAAQEKNKIPVEYNTILISTPDALLMSSKNYNLRKALYLVIDEADVVINNLELSKIQVLLKKFNIKKINLSCFSATLNEYVETIVSSFKNITKVLIEAKKAIFHEFAFGSSENIKHLALEQLLSDGVESPTLIFVKDQETAKKLSKFIPRSEVYTENGGNEILDNFRLKKIWYLFTTDVLSRGVDFYNARSVINYDVPATKTQFVHRIGRINRNNEGQKSYTIYTTDDFNKLSIITEFLEENNSKVPEHIKRIISKTKTNNDKK